MILETERLMLREMEQSDFGDLVEMLQDPEVMYAYEHDFSDEDVQAWLDRQRGRYREYGSGLWAMILKETGEMIGQAGITWQPHRDEKVLEIGYLLKKRHWHKGYAREAAAGCRDYAFDILNAPRVHSCIKADNFASQRVAESLGMARIDAYMVKYYNGEMLHYLYALDNDRRK